MSHQWTRRDFLGGTALLVAAGLTPRAQLLAQGARYYPPALGGLRGSHPGSFEVAHDVSRGGKAYDMSGLPAEESYDLVVVGGGLSGLAAAWFFREAHGASARILILDNHDDFGGHAKRNEFRVGGQLLIGYGGTECIQSPKAFFSRPVRRLYRSLGIRTKRFETAYDQTLYASLGMSQGTFFDRETFGEDRLVAGTPVITGGDSTPGLAMPRSTADAVAEFPMSEDARQRLIAFFDHPEDYLAGKTRAEKLAYLSKVSYREFLRKDARLGDEAVRFMDGATVPLAAMRPDIVPALEALESHYPGFSGLGLAGQKDPAYDEPYIYHFPDGNASIARLMVRNLIPGVATGSSMEDVVLADFDYAKLDVAGAPIRLRLNSTAVSVLNAPEPASGVAIGYVRAGTLRRVQAKHCVLACYNMMIPHLMPELPVAQKLALARSVKIPIVYVNVVARNWRAFAKAGVSQIVSPGAFYTNAKLDFPVSLGGYRFSRDPDQPIVIHMEHMPLTPNQGLSNVAQFQLGRQKIMNTPFEEYERQVVEQLDRMLGASGFQSARDIAAITANRWPHGYAYDENSLFDPQTPGPAVYEVARRRAGNVAIANSDSAWSADSSVAIDQAWRAVSELTGRSS
jgi:spermidine dehydrogenase